jgi:hypothetical protein
MSQQTRAIFMAITTVLASSQGAWAASQAAAYLARQQVNIGCDGTSGVFAQIWETDINGDGKLDLILDHANIVCDNGERSSNCGASGSCEILAYIRQGNLLVETPLPENTVAVDKLPGARLSVIIGPRLKSWRKIIRWNGRRFQ